MWLFPKNKAAGLEKCETQLVLTHYWGLDYQEIQRFLTPGSKTNFAPRPEPSNSALSDKEGRTWVPG